MICCSTYRNKEIMELSPYKWIHVILPIRLWDCGKGVCFEIEMKLSTPDALSMWILIDLYLNGLLSNVRGVLSHQIQTFMCVCRAHMIHQIVFISSCPNIYSARFFVWLWMLFHRRPTTEQQIKALEILYESCTYPIETKHDFMYCIPNRCW